MPCRKRRKTKGIIYQHNVDEHVIYRGLKNSLPYKTIKLHWKTLYWK